MNNGKLIREGRYGPPKCWKTGAIVSTYPRPLLCFEFDEGGMDVYKESTYIVRPKDFDTLMTMEKLPCDVVVVDMCDATIRQATEKYEVLANKEGFSLFTNCVNTLIKHKGGPFKTVVVDPITQLNEVILGHFAASNPAAMNDPRKWASSCGMKVQQTIAVLNQLPCHTVYIMHSMMEKNELTGTIIEVPMIPGRIRDRVGGILSQFFYACKENSKPVIYTSDKGFAKGIGARWPDNLPNPCGPTYKEIYERVG